MIRDHVFIVTLKTLTAVRTFTFEINVITIWIDDKGVVVVVVVVIIIVGGVLMNYCKSKK